MRTQKECRTLSSKKFGKALAISLFMSNFQKKYGSTNGLINFTTMHICNKVLILMMYNTFVSFISLWWVIAVVAASITSLTYSLVAWEICSHCKVIIGKESWNIGGNYIKFGGWVPIHHW